MSLHGWPVEPTWSKNVGDGSYDTYQEKLSAFWEERRAKLDAVVAAIAAELVKINHGHDFKPVPRDPDSVRSDSSARLRATDGRELYFDANRYHAKDRMTVSGGVGHELYKHAHHAARVPSITMTLAKTPVQMAKEIARRVVPALDAAIDGAAHNKVASDNYLEHRERTVALIEATGVAESSKRPHGGPPEAHRPETLYTPRGRYGTIEVYPDSIRLKDFELSVEEAVAVLGLLGSMRERADEPEEDAAAA